jgi:hypothetical protein
MSEEMLQELELNIAEAKQIVELGDALERLKNNRDFKAVILDGYFRTEAARLVMGKAHPQMQRPDTQASFLRSIDAIGELGQYFNKLRQQAEMAQIAMDEDRRTIAELAEEGAL